MHCAGRGRVAAPYWQTSNCLSRGFAQISCTHPPVILFSTAKVKIEIAKIYVPVVSRSLKILVKSSPILFGHSSSASTTIKIPKTAGKRRTYELTLLGTGQPLCDAVRSLGVGSALSSSDLRASRRSSSQDKMLRTSRNVPKIIDRIYTANH